MGTFCSGLITFDDQVDGARQTQDPVDPGRSSEEGRHDLSKRQWLPAIADALPSSPSCMEHALPSAVRSASGNGLERAQTCADAHNGAAAPGPVTSGAGYCAGEGSLSFVAAQATEQSQKNAADTPTELQHHEPRLREQAASYVHRPVEERTSNEASTVSGLETHGLVGDRAGKGQAPLVAGQGDSLKFCSGSSNGCAGCRPLMDNVVASVESVLSVDKDISNASVQNPAQGVEQDGISYADAVIAGIKLVEPENEAVQLAELANSAGTSIEGLLNFNYTAAPDTDWEEKEYSGGLPPGEFQKYVQARRDGKAGRNRRLGRRMHLVKAEKKAAKAAREKAWQATAVEEAPEEVAWAAMKSSLAARGKHGW